jgi:molybdate transport system substrate-binding protein
VDLRRRAARAVALGCASAWGLLPAACSDAAISPTGGAPRVALVLYAAASTRAALQALESAAERELGIELTLVFGSSGDLSRQIAAASPCDVFLSADERDMDGLASAGRLVERTRRDLLANQLAVIEPVPAPSSATAGSAGLDWGTPFDSARLAQPAVQRFAIAHPEAVPAGRYAKAWLSELHVYAALESRIVRCVDVRAALAAVESGAVQAGIVYTTDAALSDRVRVVHAVPRAAGPRIVYPIAVVADRSHEPAAAALVAWLDGPEAARVYARYGFARPEPARPEPARSEPARPQPADSAELETR